MAFDIISTLNQENTFDKTEELSLLSTFMIQNLKRNALPITESEELEIRKTLTELENAEKLGSLCVTIDQNRYEILKKFQLTADVEPADEPYTMKPLVAEATSEGKYRIYKERNYIAELELCRYLSAIAKTPARYSEKAMKKAALLSSDGLSFKLNAGQKKAVELALTSNLAIILGGPGTGKTTTAAAVLECLLTDNPQAQIMLAAPTGKAARNLYDSINSTSLRDNRFSELRVRARELKSATLHRFIAEKLPSGEKPSHENPFPYDIILIDESSMIGIDLAMDFFKAVSPSTRVIMMGDAYQLQAVGPGSIFDDLTKVKNGYFAQELTESHRFDSKSVLGSLASGIKSAPQKPSEKEQGIKLREMLSMPDETCQFENFLSQAPLPRSRYLSDKAEIWILDRAQKIAEAVLSYLGSQKKVEDKKKLWTSVMNDVALCALREGPMSLTIINRETEKALKNSLHSVENHAPDAGRLIIIRKNHPELDVYNGDIGIVLPEIDTVSSRQTVYFGDLGENGREILFGLLPKFDTAFAITIHQSQGSEYPNVAIFLPSSTEHNLAVNELLYTAVTRVKATKAAPGKLTFFGSTGTFDRCVVTSSKREGGFKNKLERMLCIN